MNKFVNLILIVFVMFGFIFSINSLSVSAFEDNSVIDENSIKDDRLNQDFDNNNIDASTNVIVVEDDDNPDGIFLLGVKLKDNER